MTLDNQKAKFNVGLQYPDGDSIRLTRVQGSSKLQDILLLPIGINFEVTPHVNNAGLITLDLHPQISAIYRGRLPYGQYTSCPKRANQEAETNVMVENGKTLVIAGLITRSEECHREQGPLLGGHSLVGQSFSRAPTPR